MKNNLFIPKKIRVGFQTRNDTYTKRLAYVIYYDNKGKLRKETSWESWRDKTIDPEEYDNVPTEGFVLNKNVGGRGGWYDERMAYVRVYDPRGFEFEITIPNLLYILENTNSIKGKGLEGEFVYSWDGKDIVLLPICAPDYVELQKFNEKVFRGTTLKVKDLVIGGTYIDKHNSHYIYMGKYDYYAKGYKINDKVFSTYAKMRNYCDKNNIPLYTRNGWGSRIDSLYTEEIGAYNKRYFFYCPDNDCFYSFESISGKLIATISSTPIPNFPEIFEKLEHRTEYSPLDESKNEIVYYTADELYESVQKCYYYRRFSCCCEYVSFCNLRLIDGDSKNCELHSYGEIYKYTSLFHDLGAREGDSNNMIVSYEKIVEILKPYYTKRYLANGKLYDKKG